MTDPGRNYDVLFVLGLCIMAGLSEWLPGERDVISRALPPFASAYHLLLLAGGITAAIGVWSPRLRLGLPAELAGRVLLAALMFGYGSMLMLLARPAPVVSAVVMFGFGVVCVVRVRQLLIQLRLASKQQERR